MRILAFLTSKAYFFLFFLLISFCCRNDRDKNNLKTTIPLCNKSLFVEKFEVWSGSAYDGDIVSAYLTDSVNFRVYLHTYDNAHERIAFECKGEDSICIYNQTFDTTTNKFKIVNTTIYRLSDLRKKRVFE